MTLRLARYLVACLFLRGAICFRGFASARFQLVTLTQWLAKLRTVLSAGYALSGRTLCRNYSVSQLFPQWARSHQILPGRLLSQSRERMQRKVECKKAGSKEKEPALGSRSRPRNLAAPLGAASRSCWTGLKPPRLDGLTKSETCQGIGPPGFSDPLLKLRNPPAPSAWQEDSSVRSPFLSKQLKTDPDGAQPGSK